MLLPIASSLAAVRDSYNAVLVEGDAVGTLMFYGRGAEASRLPAPWCLT